MMAIAHNPARLMLYALLSAVEEDLRDLLLGHGSAREPSEFLGPELFESTLERAFQQDELMSSVPVVDELLPFVDFADRFKLVNRHRSTLPPAAASHIRDVTPHLETLVPIRNRVMHSRPLKGTDLTEAFDIAERLAAAKVGPWEHLRETLARFAKDPGFVHGIKIPIPPDSSDEVANNLPTPDFDETGFVGREEVSTRIRDALLGAYPVVTLVGEGAVGKTAAALNAAYAILDDPNCPYEAIIWSSSKTHVLTGLEVQRIEGAITTSMGLIRAVAEELAGSQGEDPINEVLEYLSEFRILLILDNLETVLDERMRDFLGRLPVGSKVLVTSRIGLGAFEFPIDLDAMPSAEAVTLMRTLARVRQVEGLVRCSNQQIAGYCERLHNSPGFVKWFVAGVQAGSRPEDFLANPDVFLDFCLSNVYDFLSDGAKAAVRVLMAVPEQLGKGEIGFYAGLENIALTQAINQLFRTNMVTAQYVPAGRTYDSLYQIGEMARAYLAKHHPLSAEELGAVQGRRRQIVAAREDYATAGRRNPYLRSTVSIRSPRDVVAARLLTEALRASRRGDYQAARENVNRAQGLAPEYYEVHRVAAFVDLESGQVLQAKQAFDMAVELNPESPQLRYFRGRFLLEQLDDMDGAERDLQIARGMAPDQPEVMSTLGRVWLYSGRVDEARDILAPMLDGPHETHVHRYVADLILQTHTRAADRFAHESRYESALGKMEDASAFLEGLDPELVDRRMLVHLAKTKRFLSRIDRWAVGIGGDYEQRSSAIQKWVEARTPSPADTVPTTDRSRQNGTVFSLPVMENYGFLRVTNGSEHFFHRSRLRDPAVWESLSVGAVVSCDIEPVPDGQPAAVDLVVQKEGRVVRDELGQELIGIIRQLHPQRGFGFVRAVDGPSYFFHRSMVPKVADWVALREGAEVTFEVGVNALDGHVCARSLRLVGLRAASDFT